MTVPKKDPDRDIESADDDEDEPSLPQPEDDESVATDLGGEGGSLAAGRAAVLHYAKLAPAQPGVYRMIDARGDVLYVGKANNVRNRVRAYA
ncbi:MAG TPA: GIY-YIG nuclease family protein, partial [Xanthobacteraceae bacterium]|nr:GIY-YIG nuclease family protein [Xanthobacteraceae bacterium]